jgi:hypothetical protein
MTLYGFGRPNPFLAMYRLLGHDYVMPVQFLSKPVMRLGLHRPDQRQAGAVAPATT